MTLLVVALAAFVGTHFLLSHPLRGPLVARLGDGGFAILYSLVAFATFGWAVWEFRRAPAVVWWVAPTWAWPAGAVVMLFASILLVGSVATPNPALMGGRAVGPERGVQRITRHPMMWAFALWAVVHAGLSGVGRTVLLAAAILILALVGARAQDAKKRKLTGEAWAVHEAATSFVPFGRGFATPGWTALIGGIILFAGATWLHPLVGGPNLWEVL